MEERKEAAIKRLRGKAKMLDAAGKAAHDERQTVLQLDADLAAARIELTQVQVQVVDQPTAPPPTGSAQTVVESLQAFYTQLDNQLQIECLMEILLLTFLSNICMKLMSKTTLFGNIMLDRQKHLGTNVIIQE